MCIANKEPDSHKDFYIIGFMSPSFFFSPIRIAFMTRQKDYFFFWKCYSKLLKPNWFLKINKHFVGSVDDSEGVILYFRKILLDP